MFNFLDGLDLNARKLSEVVGSDFESDRECRRTRKTKIFPPEDGKFPEIVENKRKTYGTVKLQRRVPLCGVKCTNSMINLVDTE